MLTIFARFHSRYKRTEHENICLWKKSVVCEFCWSAFSSREALRIHVNAKHFGKCYLCFCGKVFTSETILFTDIKETNINW